MISNQAGCYGLLLSGGIDSAILLGSFLERGATVQPFYVRSGLIWEDAEQDALRKLLATWQSPRLAPLVTLDVPVQDIYGTHWSITGNHVPDAQTQDGAVYLPGRNALLLLKAALWCAAHDIDQVAMATLSANPFSDATDLFFQSFEETIRLACGKRIRILRPFDSMPKDDVLALGSHFPLQHTFSCIAPKEGLHCGCCNKCAERQAAFRKANQPDPTEYVGSPSIANRWRYAQDRADTPQRNDLAKKK